MYSLRIRNVMERKKRLTAAPDLTVTKAALKMREKNVGAVMVVEDGRLIGIFTERDAVFRVIAARRSPCETTIGEVMTRDPLTASPEETFGHALHVMYEKGFRHLPVVEDGKCVGIVSARSALDPDMEEFVAETQRRLHIR